jgi:beta-glucosidase
MTGEAAARTRLDLPGNQEALLKAVMRLNKPTVLILFTGRPLAITWAASHVPAILEAWYPGIEAGPAVVDILFGETNPSAKLTATFPRSVGQVPIYYDALPTGRPPVNVDLTHPPAGGGEKYFSRYIDETNAPLYPFGYGLSYTQFSTSVPTISQTQVSSDALTKGTRLRVTVEVKNTGQVRGVEITQLYIRNTGSNTEQPVRQLRGFRRVPLDPGQSAHVEFDLGFDELSHLDPQYNPIVEPSRYQIWVGDSSETTNGTQLEVVP